MTLAMFNVTFIRCSYIIIIIMFFILYIRYFPFSISLTAHDRLMNYTIDFAVQSTQEGI